MDWIPAFAGMTDWFTPKSRVRFDEPEAGGAISDVTNSGFPPARE
jgi:hypothetical protein